MFIEFIQASYFFTLFIFFSHIQVLVNSLVSRGSCGFNLLFLSDTYSDSGALSVGCFFIKIVFLGGTVPLILFSSCGIVKANDTR